MTKFKLNWSRGLFRLWLVLAVLWVTALFLALRPDQDLRESRRILGLVEAQRAEVSLEEVPADGDAVTRMRVAVLTLRQDRARNGEAEALVIEGQPWTRDWGAGPKNPENTGLSTLQLLAVAEAEVRLATGRAAQAHSAAVEKLATVAVPPAVILTVGAALLWAFKGFRGQHG